MASILSLPRGGAALGLMRLPVGPLLPHPPGRRREGAGEERGEEHGEGGTPAGSEMPPEPPAIAWRRYGLWVFWAVFLVLMAASLADWASAATERFGGVSLATLPGGVGRFLPIAPWFG